MKIDIKKQHIIIGVILLVILIPIGILLSSSGTDPDKTIYLKGSGSQFDGSTWNNPFYVSVNPDGDKANYSVWHLVYSNKSGIEEITTMKITFTNGSEFQWDQSMGFSTNGGGNNSGWVIYAPSDYEIDISNNVSYVMTNDDKNAQFNISGYSKGKETQNFEFGSVSLTKVDSKNSEKLLSGVTFSLKDKDGKTIEKETVDGVASWTELGLGEYTITETETITGYNIESFKLYDKDNNQISDNKITISEDHLDLKLTATNDQEIVKDTTGSISLTKVDSEDSDKLLSGAIFSIEDKDGNITTKEAIDGLVSWSDLVPGEYIIKEIKSPDGYDKQTYKLYDENNNLITDNKVSLGENNLNLKLKATNNKENAVGTVLLAKLDSTRLDILLSGAVFSLEDKDGNKITKESVLGMAMWSDLPFGEYTLTETKAASGYNLDSFKLFDENSNPVENNKIIIDKDNLNLKFVSTNDIEIVRNLSGSVSLIKTDADDTEKRLSGAVFSLENKDGDIITKEAINGTASWSDLRLGEYTIKEIEAANGYDKDTFQLFDENNDPIDDNKIIIGDGDLDLKLSATNKKETVQENLGSISLTKTDSKNKEKLLSGAVFSLEDKDGNIVTKEAINGKASWSDLPFGEYTLAETKAASGYDLNTFKLFDEDNNIITDNKVSINNDYQNLKLVSTNSKKDVQGEVATPGGTKDDDDNNTTSASVKGEHSKPSDTEKTLGEEEKTSDMMKIALWAFVILAALAVVGIIAAYRGSKKQK